MKTLIVLLLVLLFIHFDMTSGLPFKSELPFGILPNLSGMKAKPKGFATESYMLTTYWIEINKIGNSARYCFIFCIAIASYFTVLKRFKLKINPNLVKQRDPNLFQDKDWICSTFYSLQHFAGSSIWIDVALWRLTKSMLY